MKDLNQKNAIAKMMQCTEYQNKRNVNEESILGESRHSIAGYILQGVHAADAVSLNERDRQGQ